MEPVERRGLSILVWLVALSLGALRVSEAAGLKYLQDVTWPTALYTFQRLEPEPVKVAIVGTSRSSFGLVPTVIDPCLYRRLGEPARSVNLSRVFASILTEAILVRTLFEDDLPAHLLVEVAPEIVNSDHHEMALNMAWNADLRDVPACLEAARPGGLSACARPLFRGVESIARLIDGGYRDDDHLSWMMLYHRGGQYCYGDAACERHNSDYLERLRPRWGVRMKRVLPGLGAERFGSYRVGEGIAHDYTLDLIEWARARQVDLTFINMPVREAYQQEIPPADYEAFLSYMEGLAATHDVGFYDANSSSWRRRREGWLDADHLAPAGARRLSLEVCHRVLVPRITGWEVSSP